MFRVFLYAIVLLAGSIQASYSDGQKVCPPGVSQLAKTMLNCVKKGGGGIKEPEEKQITEPEGQPIERANVHEFLTSLAGMIARKSPTPFNAYPVEKLLIKDRQKGNYSLIIPLSHFHRSEMKAHDVSERLLLALNKIKNSPLFAERKVTIQVHTDFVPAKEKSQDRNCKPFHRNHDVAVCRASYIGKLLRKNNLNSFKIIAKGDRQSDCRKAYKISCNSEEISFERQVRIVVSAS